MRMLPLAMMSCVMTTCMIVACAGAEPFAASGQVGYLQEWELKASLAKKPEAAAATSASTKAAPAADPGAPARKPAKRSPARVAQMRTESGRKA